MKIAQLVLLLMSLAQGFASVAAQEMSVVSTNEQTRIVVHALENGQPVRLILDTGCERTILTDRAAKRLKATKVSG